jgi:hypothetical protein
MSFCAEKARLELQKLGDVLPSWSGPLRRKLSLPFSSRLLLLLFPVIGILLNTANQSVCRKRQQRDARFHDCGGQGALKGKR